MSIIPACTANDLKHGTRTPQYSQSHSRLDHHQLVLLARLLDAPSGLTWLATDGDWLSVSEFFVFLFLFFADPLLSLVLLLIITHAVICRKSALCLFGFWKQKSR